MKNMKHNQSGFSLLELMISLAILGVVLAGIVLMFTNTSSYNSKQEMMTDVAQDLRVVKNLMVDEIRSAGTNPIDDIRIGFQDDGDDRLDTDQNSINFTRDIDNNDGDQFFEPDGDADDPNEDIGYWRRDAGGNILNVGDNTVGSLVRRSGGGGGQEVMQNVIDLEFRYFDEDNNVIPPGTMTNNAVLSTIRTVEVRIVGQVDRPNLMDPQFRTWTQQFRIKVRNL